VNIATREAPSYTAAKAEPDVANSWLIFLGLDDPAPVYQLYDDAEAGRLAEQIMLIGGCPTRHDPTQAPSGNHAAFMWQKTPYNLHGNPLNWDAHKPRQLEAVLEFWARYAPNVLGDNLLTAFAGSPLDTERRYPSMGRGDLFHGWMGPWQRGVERPFPGGKLWNRGWTTAKPAKPAMPRYSMRSSSEVHAITQGIWHPAAPVVSGKIGSIGQKIGCRARSTRPEADAR
jgi:phytoene dehydrogenase-like protein